MKIYVLFTLGSVAEFLEKTLDLDRIFVDSVIGDLVRYESNCHDSITYIQPDIKGNSVSFVVRPYFPPLGSCQYILCVV